MSLRPDANSSAGTLEGKILFAAPALDGSVFKRSVILVAKHSKEDGAFGLVLNQPSDQVVGDLIPSDEFAPLAKIPVHIGGPVSPGHLSFTALWLNDEGKLQYAAQTSAKNAIRRDRQPGTLVRAFVGYTGWSAGQLEDELKKDSWVLADVPESLLGTAHDESMWAANLRQMGPFHRVLAEFPERPELN